jgi:hypothetical protein
LLLTSTTNGSSRHYRSCLAVGDGTAAFPFTDLPVLPTIRSLAYFLPVIEEIRRQPLPSHYLDYLRHKVYGLPAR